jgi:acetoin utilization deacetylase AcuC-like enzyme
VRGGGLVVHLAGGTHHAFANAGQGFCVFNDIAVASRVLLKVGRIRRAVVTDWDV